MKPTRRDSLLHAIGDEGLRLFFPLAALQAALWPLLWVSVHGFDLPLAREVPPSLWHAHEMLFGAFGAALIGFLTTSVPEWTDTPRPRGRPLFVLAAVWGVARLIGFAGADDLGVAAALADLVWLVALVAFVARTALNRRRSRLSGFVFWLAVLTLAEGVTRYAFATGDVALGQTGLRTAGFSLLALLGLALARITPPITNLVLDPSEATSPFRPHPGRVNLAPGLIAVLVAGEWAGLSAPVTGYLAIAAGAAFLDRVAEAFIGREAFRTEILAMAGSSALAGLGLLLVGAARLGAPWPETAGLHVAFMGGLGLGVLAVFVLAGLLHTGQPLGLPRSTKLALALLGIGLALRVAPDLAPSLRLGPPHLAASVAWAGAFLIWLRGYWPLLSDPATLDDHLC